LRRPSIGFHRTVKGIQRNETLEVVRVGAKGVVAHNDRGEERTLTIKQARSFDVYERRAMEVAAGDKLLLTANRRESGFRATNGEIVTVSRVDEGGRIQLEDGRELPPDFRHFAHGYAITAHRSQGKSVDSVIISGDGMRKEKTIANHEKASEASAGCWSGSQPPRCSARTAEGEGGREKGTAGASWCACSLSPR